MMNSENGRIRSRKRCFKIIAVKGGEEEIDTVGEKNHFRRNDGEMKKGNGL